MKNEGIKDCYLISTCTLDSIDIPIQKIEISDEDINVAVQTELESYYELIDVVNRDIVENGDFVNISYEVYCDGKLVNQADNEGLKVGAGYFEEQIEKQLIGAKVGKEYVIYIKVPDNDENQEFAGKSEEVILTVNSIMYMKTVELSDEFVKTNYEGLNCVDDFYEYLKVKLNKEAEQEAIETQKKQVYESVIEQSEFSLDDDSVLNYALSLYNDYKEMSDGYGTTMEEFIYDFKGESLDTFYDTCYQEAENEIKRMLVTGYYAYKENLSVTDNEVLERLKNKNMSLEDITSRDKQEIIYLTLEDKIIEKVNE